MHLTNVRLPREVSGCEACLDPMATHPLRCTLSRVLVS